jgi:two-component system NtrC family response regulator
VLEPGDFLGVERGETEVGRAGQGVDGMTLDQVERHLIEKLLEQHQGNISRVAKALGLSRAALYRRLEKHGLSGGKDAS